MQEEGKVKQKKEDVKADREVAWHTPSIFSSKLQRQSENQRGETELY